MVWGVGAGPDRTRLHRGQGHRHSRPSSTTLISRNRKDITAAYPELPRPHEPLDQLVTAERLSPLAYGPDPEIGHAVRVGINLEGRLRVVMRVSSRAWRQSRCRHTATVSVCSTGVERVVCELCGHVSVHFLSDMESEVDRARFARQGERGPNQARRTSAG